MYNNQLKINEAANFLGVSIDTLRRWDNDGLLKALKEKTGDHRYYNLIQLKEFLKANSVDLAMKWARSEVGKEPHDIFYCSNSSVFQGRLYKFRKELSTDKEISPLFSLLISMVGEIGDNSFAHNLGNWSDIMGVFFAYDLKEKVIVVADRGQGLFKTLKRVKPGLNNDEEALGVAFTEIISGRAPESRGNGLKYVRSIVEKNPLSLFFQSGEAELKLKEHDAMLKIKKAKTPIRGCLAIIKF